MHPVGFIELFQCCIDEWISGFCSFDFFHYNRVILPEDCSAFFLKLDIIYRREIISNLIPKIPPNNFWKQCWIILKACIYFSNRKNPETYIWWESGRSIDSRRVSQTLIGWEITIKSLISKWQRPILMIFSSYTCYFLVIIRRCKKSCICTFEFLYQSIFRMSHDIPFPEQGKRGEYFSCFTYMRSNHQKIFWSMKRNLWFLTERFYSIIPKNSFRRIRMVYIHCIHWIPLYNIFNYLLRISTINKNFSTMLSKTLIYRVNRFSDESKTWIIFSKAFYRASIMDKNQQNFLWVSDSFKESCIVLKA